MFLANFDPILRRDQLNERILNKEDSKNNLSRSKKWPSFSIGVYTCILIGMPKDSGFSQLVHSYDVSANSTKSELRGLCGSMYFWGLVGFLSSGMAISDEPLHPMLLFSSDNKFV
jgi:hypothetical protein